MAIVTGTAGNDDGVSAPSLFGANGDTVFGLAGDDVLATSGSFFSSSPAAALLDGGSGNDRYWVGPAYSFPIYSTPVIWVTVWSDAEIVEAISETDTADRLDADGATAANTVLGFDGRHVTLATTTVFSPTVQITTLRLITLRDAYGFGADGTLLAGVETLGFAAGLTLDLRHAHALLPFLREGTAAGDTLAGGDGAEVLSAGAGGDTVAAGAGDDLVAAGAGGDTVAAGAGDDRLHGGADDDTLRGGSGDDTLQGGSGNDRLAGGAGADCFRFGAGDGRDRIRDFTPGEDRLDLTGLVPDAAAFAAALRSGAGGEAVIEAGGVRIVLLGLTPAEIDAADAILG